jgi:Glycosyl transferase family 2
MNERRAAAADAAGSNLASDGSLAAGTSARDTPLRLSVIIANYNYARFLGETIASALNLDWPDVEVIVVNNGSTDASSDVIAGFGDRIRSVHLEVNRGHLGACNIGFEKSSGDVVYFLDADDVVEPEMMREVAAVWSARLSAVQFQTRIIDAQSKPTGGFFPQYRFLPTSTQLSDMARTIGNYPGPHGPGNIYARWFLDRIFPLQPVAGPFADSCCIAAAPYLGEIAVLPKPLVRYRVHGGNTYLTTAAEGSRYSQRFANAMGMFGYSREIASSVGIPVEPNAIDRSLHTLAMRVASFRLAPQTHAVARDTRGHLAALLLNSLRYPQGLMWTQKVSIAAWGIATLAVPSAWAQHLVNWRYSPTTRPKLLARALALLGVLKSEVTARRQRTR